jgi:membrane protein implicated in regulation of membrane protease activity
MPTWTKYLLFQIPGWMIAAIVLSGLWYWKLLPQWLSVLCYIVWVLKDLLLYPLLRAAYVPGKTGLEALVGTRGIAQGDLAPEGYVRVRGELWRAITHSQDRVISSGATVEILKTEGMKVRVRSVNG